MMERIIHSVMTRRACVTGLAPASLQVLCRAHRFISSSTSGCGLLLVRIMASLAHLR